MRLQTKSKHTENQRDYPSAIILSIKVARLPQKKEKRHVSLRADLTGRGIEVERTTFSFPWSTTSTFTFAPIPAPIRPFFSITPPLDWSLSWAFELFVLDDIGGCVRGAWTSCSVVEVSYGSVLASAPEVWEDSGP
jgi:hypothetical protein